MRPGKIIGFLVCTFILLLLGSNSDAQISVGGALSKFASAGVAYKEGRYDEAISRYNEILSAGRENGPIYYNLGNSYFKKGDMGNTALNYVRAKKFIPRDSDLMFNEKYIQSKIDQYGVEKNPNVFEDVLKDFIRFLTVDEMVIIVVGLIVIVGFLVICSQYFRWPPQWSRWVLGLLVTIFAVFVISLMVKVSYEANLAVIMKRTDSYFEPRADSTVHFKMSEGMTIRVLKTEGNWTKIQRLDGKIGWIDIKNAEKI